MKKILLLTIIAFLFGCERLGQQVCSDNLNGHLSSLNLADKSGSPIAIRQMFNQMASLVRTADIKGCNSQTKFALQELYAASVSAEQALSDENILAYGFLNIFDAEEYSPLQQKITQATKRFKSACKILNQNGVNC